jgi:hypothetical protein
MIPFVATAAAFNLPDDAHAPDPDEVDEEGYGYFIGVWNIGVGLPHSDAQKLAAWERRAVAFVDERSTGPDEFEDLAVVLESFVTDDDLTVAGEFPHLDVATAEGAQGVLDSTDELLDGIELGVAGLVAALSSAGFFPAASCRGHAPSSAWADRPTVYFGAARDRVARLESAVLSTGCRLDDGSGNGAGLVAVRAPSVTAAMALTQAILAMDLPPLG